MSEIANAAVGTGLDALFAGGRGGVSSLGQGLVSALLGAPGRATGGPVSPGRAYRVGEDGPELFVPTASGRIEAPGHPRAARDVRVTINLTAPRWRRW